jgi:hypothetical protein
MPTVSFATFSYWKDSPRLHQPEYLKRIIDYHNYNFNEVILVHQRLTNEQKMALPPIDIPNLKIVDSNYENLREFGMPDYDEIAEACCNGESDPHYYKKHLCNHAAAVKAATSDFILFSDSDISMVRNGPPSWINVAIDVLNKYPDVFVVTPDEGGNDMWKRAPEGRFTLHSSQQIFLIKRTDLLNMDWNVWWDWPLNASWPTKTRNGHPNGYLAPNRPMAQFYKMLEGLIYCWMRKMNKYRFVLDGTRWRYWHDGAANK